MLTCYKEVRWFKKTDTGWYEIFHVKFTEKEKQLIESNNPEREIVLKEFQEKSIQKSNPPILVKQAFEQHHNPESDLIMANINEKGQGTIFSKINSNCRKFEF